MTQVGVKPLDIARLLNMPMQKRDCFVFQVQVKETSLRISLLAAYNLTKLNVNYIGGALGFSDMH